MSRRPGGAATAATPAAPASAASDIASCDVGIVGGGMVGASLALALAGSRLSVTLIEAVAAVSAEQPSFDDRTTALGNGARRIFDTLGVWPRIAERAAPISEIQVSDAGHFGSARLEAREHGLGAFGYTVSNRHLGQVLWQALGEPGGTTLLSPARVTALEFAPEAALLTVASEQGAARVLRVRLVVAADGAQSLIKQQAGIVSSSRDYGQVALVANVRTGRAARGIAYERFTDSGAVAMLPLHDGGYTVVWALPPDRARSLQQCESELFRAQLQQRLGWRAGAILEVARRAAYPLSLVQAQSSGARRVVVVGNAAQTLHPVAAQGFNLGLRDAAVLAEMLLAANDPGEPSLIEEYGRRRAADRRGMVAFTDRLVRLFGARHGGLVWARNVGLLMFDQSPLAKRALSQLSWGFGGALPRLSRGLPLS
jgi:2-octaprenyl-6-methoxyphenol hydroxylase